MKLNVQLLDHMDMLSEPIAKQNKDDFEPISAASRNIKLGPIDAPSAPVNTPLKTCHDPLETMLAETVHWIT